ncbi:exportin-2 [Homalodisca vitripennis]|uniref:exportin-2 n=1 Tax=Homalodisca vitripennis TaxID=197043 RepID=UPI001EEBBA2D|nr:exportin-2 [Homalodisca vitripennis]KAG8250095.1 Exportin-2 [Homalodisca vitripennis]
MELSDENLITLSRYLQQTLSPDNNVRRPAEKFLESVEGNKNYPLLLLHLVGKGEVDITIRIAGAVAFKNYVKRNWKVNEDINDRIHQDDREAVKQVIVNMMLVSPEAIQKQLSDAISIIGKSDFPEKWPNLISDMVEKFASEDFHIINGVLHTAHSLFKRYRFEFKSQALWTEIKFVLDKFAKPLTDLFVATVEFTKTHAKTDAEFKITYSSLLLITKIYYSLSFQDLPEFLEDNMTIWMDHLHFLLTNEVACLKTDEDEEAGLLEQIKSQICDNVALYAQKYDEEFTQYLPTFVTDVWSLLISTGKQPKYDALVSNALQFLATVADRNHHRHLFEDPTVLSNICEKVVIPNMEFRPSDEELFEDNPEEYIRRDIEGSDVDTRRRAACDLVKVLSRFFEEKMMTIFGQYVQAMLQQYSADPASWKAKDAALYLVTSLASRGQTQKHGITQTSSLVSLPDFCAQHIMPELQKPDVNAVPVLKADAIKYVMIFRSLLPREVVVGSLPLLVRHLQANSVVVHTYAACAIDKILLIKENDKAIVSSEDLSPLAAELLTGLFSRLDQPGSEENEYVMKTIMRSFSTLQERVVPFLGELLPKLTDKLGIIARNPSKPHFNHFLFETLVLSIRIVCKTNVGAVASFEEALFPLFQNILQQDVQEFVPYVFQILSLLLELHGPGQIPEPYLALYPCLLAPVLWERTGNVHPLVRLLRAYIHKCAPPQMQSVLKVSGLLGVFQKMIASRANDHEGFYLMQSLIEHCPNELLSQYMKDVFVLLFQRLSSSKTTKYIKGLLVFFFFYTINYGASNLIQLVDSIQVQMFGMVIERLMIPDIQKISGSVERKITAVGLTKLLCEAPELIDGPYSSFWTPLLKVLIGLFELPEDETTYQDDHFIEVDETPGYEVAYSQLAFASKTDYDPLQGVGDPRLHLAQSLSKLSVACPGRLNPLLQNGLGDADRSHLQTYLNAANVTLS